MKYTRGYKYQLEETEYYQTNIKGYDVNFKFIFLKENGVLKIKHGYAWDGPSGPTIDTKNFMRGSLVHDALYELMDRGLLPISYKEQVDQILIDICDKDGMSNIRQWWVYKGVQYGGKPGNYKKKKPILEAP